MSPIPIILDIDPGIDDTLALILAVKSKAFDIKGLTICSGNVDSEQGVKNAAYILDFLDVNHIPIYQGPVHTLYPDYTDARDTHGEDGLGEAVFADSGQAQALPAYQYIIQQLNQSPNTITLVALGPLTNLALAEQAQPGILKKAKEIRIMGGVHTVQGNCSAVAEYNFWCDPDAARIVFNADLPETYLYPLDVTYDILMTPAIRELINQFNTPLSQLIHKITRFYVDFHWKVERTLGCVINDPLVIADSIQPITHFKRAHIQIKTQGTNRGQGVTEFTPNGSIHVGVEVNALAFFDYFLRTLFPEFEADITLFQNKISK